MSTATKPAAFREVQLKEILKYLDERIELEDLREYTTITVKRRHGGLEAREKLLGHQIKTKKQFRLVPGAFIISRIQCWHQAYALVDEVPPGMIASSNYDQFGICPDVDRRYFWWLSHSPRFTETVRSSASGVVIEKMVFDRDAWLEKTIPLPPIAEQRRIVSRVEEMAARVEEAQQLRELATQEAGRINSAVASELVRLAGGKQLPVGELIRSEGLQNGKSVKSNGIGNVRCLTLSAMRNGTVNITSSKLVSMPPELVATCSVRNGDVFVVRGNGSKELCGRAGLVVESQPGLVFPDLFIRVPLQSQRIIPEFFVMVWNSPLVRVVLEEKAKTTSGIWKINQGHILSTTIPVPDIQRQRDLSARVKNLSGTVAALARLQATTSIELDALLPSILDKAFKGEL